MSENNSTSPDTRVQDAIYDLITELLGEGGSAAEISYHLTLHALNLGVQFAPSAHHAYSVVASAILHTSQHHAGAESEAETDPIESEAVLKETESSISISPEPGDKTVH